uniref:NADH:ubiquinone reductase (H(+)-translocating) n=1 Tax=Botrylloides violaceus TaxID=581057 RepID=A0A024GX12_BOTVI|nr:NADH dehydrogenase subunit 5 [Botrylloides violaceus]CCO25695.1 NADH dehydrogenase subunit 5 [Botrylloides violaceus]
MVGSLIYLSSLIFFVFLFFLLLGLQILFWKSLLMKTLGNVFTIYKFILMGGFVMFELFLFSLENCFLNIFMEMDLWFGLGVHFCVDFYSCLFFIFGMGVSWSIMQFGLDYMVDEKLVGNFLLFLLIFLVLMFILVFSGNFLLLFIGWEGVGLLSFLLISWWGGRYDASSGALQAVYYNRVGDAGLLMFLILSLSLGNGIWILNGFMGSSFFFLFILGVISKSSQLLFHPWLPNAMEGPTPVSSLLHSSTMVMAGVFLLMRSLEFFDYLNLIFYMGLFTCLLGGFLGLSHKDFKKVVAYSTTSQLGFMMMVLGTGWSWLCLLYMAVHAFFKAMIFMMSGVVIHMSGGIQDFRHMYSSLGLNSFMFSFYFWGGFVMVGFPFLSAFWMKDLILEGIVGGYLGFFTWCFFFFSVMLTGAYSVRLYVGSFMSGLLVQCKVMVLKVLGPFWPFLRLGAGSVGVGGLIFMLMGPFGHYLMEAQDKFYALFVLIVGATLSVVLKDVLRSFTYVLGGYLLFFNPLVHKFLSFGGYWGSRVAGLFDFIMVEYFFYGGVKYLWSLGVSLRVLVVFGGALLFYYF